MISLGLLETNSIARGVIAGDAMLKAAEVTLLKAGAVCPGKYTVVIYGEVAAVSAAIPLVVAGTAATGGALLVVAAGGVIVSVGAGMLVDNIVKNTFSKSIEDFAGNLYDDLIGSDTLSSILKKPGGDGGGGGRNSGSGGRGDGPVTLDALQW